MIIPSIDLMNGQAVQLEGGKKMVIEAGNPMPIAQKFSIAGDIAVIDLDAALTQGDNEEMIRKIISKYPCRVGGGIRDVETAKKWIDLGAKKIILGTMATPEILSLLPKEKVIAALDACDGEVVVNGWRENTKVNVLDKIKELKSYVSGFLITMVEREGSMRGVNMDMVKSVLKRAGDIRVTVAGGVKNAAEVGEIDKIGADVQVGMALYSNKMDLGEAIAAPLKSDRPDGLWATVVADEDGYVLGLVYSDLESVKEAVKRQMGVYHSRSRGLWIKGLTSGDTQELFKIDLDCDRDAMRFTVRQNGTGFCHLGTYSCFGDKQHKVISVKFEK